MNNMVYMKYFKWSKILLFHYSIKFILILILQYLIRFFVKYFHNLNRYRFYNNIYEIQVRSKSGLALKQGLMVLNSPGTIDQGYTGEIQVILFNTSKEKVKIEKGQKVAQAVLCPVVAGKWIKLIPLGSHIVYYSLKEENH